MKIKAEKHKHLETFINMIENKFSAHLKVLISDNGHEFLMTNFFLIEHR